MKHIAIISGSVRQGRLSHRVALYLKRYIEDNYDATAEVLDLKEYNFPLFEERLKYQQNPSPQMRDFETRFGRASGLIIVSPVYNAGYSAAVKNIIDFFVEEWKDKVTAVCSVTYGANQGIATAMQLQALLLKLGALVVPFAWTVTKAETEFDAEGTPSDKETAGKWASTLIDKTMQLIMNYS